MLDDLLDFIYLCPCNDTQKLLSICLAFVTGAYVFFDVSLLRDPPDVLTNSFEHILYRKVLIVRIESLPWIVQ